MRLASEFKYQMDTQSKMGYARREGRQEIAKTMKANKVPIDQIVVYTGLTIQQIEEL